MTREHSLGMFQIGGGIAGDFPICVVPMLHQDWGRDVRRWGYFCQISDSTTSYSSYSGAVPNEKITWGKLRADTQRFIMPWPSKRRSCCSMNPPRTPTLTTKRERINLTRLAI